MDIPLVHRQYHAVLDRVRPGKPFSGQLVLVTGAGAGIGQQTALAFARKGAQVIAADIDLDAAERTADLAAEATAPAYAIEIDVADAEAMEKFASTVATEHGVPDIVINNAGVGLAGPFLQTTLDDWERVIGVNLWGVIHGSRLFAQQMAERGQGGHIVNVASMAAFTPHRGISAYATTKAAVLMLTECMRAELADHGIKVSGICPGLINTDIIKSTRFVGPRDPEKTRAKTEKLYQLRHFTPERVANEIVFAVQSNRAVLPITLEAKLMQTLSRVSPSTMRLLARVEVK
jgi:NAD(P)-dependent dehydrogenase (short-subunit alcohol dehydrogenase family)